MGRIVSLISMWKELSDNWIVKKKQCCQKFKFWGILPISRFPTSHSAFYSNASNPLLAIILPLESWKGHFPAAVSMLHDIMVVLLCKVDKSSTVHVVYCKILHKLQDNVWFPNTALFKATVSDFHTSQSVWERLQLLWGWRQVASHRAIESGRPDIDGAARSAQLLQQFVSKFLKNDPVWLLISYFFSSLNDICKINCTHYEEYIRMSSRVSADLSADVDWQDLPAQRLSLSLFRS